MLLTERGGCGRPIGLPLVSSSWWLCLLVCAFHPFYRSLSQPYHEFQLPSCCSCPLQIRPFEYRPLRCLFSHRFLCLCFFFWARPSCRVSPGVHTLIHGNTSSRDKKFRPSPCLFVGFDVFRCRCSVAFLHRLRRFFVHVWLAAAVFVFALSSPPLLVFLCLLVAACWCGCFGLLCVHLLHLVGVHLLFTFPFSAVAAVVLLSLLALLCSCRLCSCRLRWFTLTLLLSALLLAP